MRTREPKLRIEQLAIESVTIADVQNFIANECSSQREAADFFNVDLSTVGRWMMGTVKPHPACCTAVALYRRYAQLQEVA
jgi:hypothetical protein